MSINEILQELPKLTESEKRQLWNVLDLALSLDSMPYRGSKVKKRRGVLKLIHGNYLN